jgi:hypothetical protein
METRAGWVKLYRSIQATELWREKPFSKAHAWLDLLLWAAWKPTSRYFQGQTFHLARGQLVTTIRHLARQWGWSRNKVKAFLRHKSATKWASIEPQKGHQHIVVTICDYESCQSEPNEKGHQRATEGPPKGPRKDHDIRIEEASKNTRSKEAPPTPPTNHLDTRLAKLYRKNINGGIGFATCKEQINRALKIGVKSGDIEAAFMNPRNVHEKIWDILDPMNDKVKRHKNKVDWKTLTKDKP